MISMSGSVGILPERKGTAPGTFCSERSEKMPSMAARPLLISTWRPRARLDSSCLARDARKGRRSTLKPCGG